MDHVKSLFLDKIWRDFFAPRVSETKQTAVMIETLDSTDSKMVSNNWNAFWNFQEKTWSPTASTRSQHIAVGLFEFLITSQSWTYQCTSCPVEPADSRHGKPPTMSGGFPCRLLRSGRSLSFKNQWIPWRLKVVSLHQSSNRLSFTHWVPRPLASPSNYQSCFIAFKNTLYKLMENLLDTNTSKVQDV